MTDSQPYAAHKSPPIYADESKRIGSKQNDEYPLNFAELKKPRVSDFIESVKELGESIITTSKIIEVNLQELSLKIAEKTKELSDLYSEFNQKLAKFKAGKC